MALDYAAAVNAEIKDLFAAGADVVQIDEPYTGAAREGAQHGLKALDRALDGVTGTTAVHICFGHAAIIHVRPPGLFPPELEGSPVKQVSIETAQSNLDCSVLRQLPSKTIILGVPDLSDMSVEAPATVAARIRRALRTCRPSGSWSLPIAGLNTSRARWRSARCGRWWKAPRSYAASFEHAPAEICGSDCAKFATPEGKISPLPPAYPRFALPLYGWEAS